jgi:hypothetical protein
MLRAERVLLNSDSTRQRKCHVGKRPVISDELIDTTAHLVGVMLCVN